MLRQDTQTIQSLPLDSASPGLVLDMVHPDAAVDALFRDWEAAVVAPAPWQMPSLMEVTTLERGDRVFRFNMQYEDPTGQGRASASMRYDRALVTRGVVPDDVTITATLEFENALTSPTGDNHTYVRPWVGIVGRMQDVRHYYFFCLQHPDAAVLYRREDDLWITLGSCPVLAHWGPHTLKLVMRGNQLEGWVDGERRIAVADYGYAGGKAGLRATCSSHVYRCDIAATARGLHRHRAARHAADEEIAMWRDALPRPVLAKSLDLRDLGEIAMVRLAPFASAAKPLQLLAVARGNPRGTNLILQTLERETIWAAPVPPMLKAIATEPRADGHCDVFGITAEEMMLLDGRTGQILARAPLPTLPGRPDLGWQNLPFAPVNLSGGPVAREFLLQGTTNPGDRHANDGEDIFAYDENLHQLWYRHIPLHYGHAWAVSACDVNGDGREEIIAGRTLLTADGEILWALDEMDAALAGYGGGHVDAAAIGFFSGLDQPATVHIQASSAGHYVVDALSGEILVCHRQGHAQESQVGKYVPQEPGLQVLVGNRWGNYGLFALYAGDGRRLSTFQPDYVAESGPALNWAGDGQELALIVTDPTRAGAYDYRGRRLLDLTPFLPNGEGVFNLRGSLYFCQDVLGDPRDEIIMNARGAVHIVTQAEPLATGTRVYAPRKRFNVSHPGWAIV